MSEHHLVKVNASEFRKLKRISDGLLHLVGEIPDLCVCESGDPKFGVGPTTCQVHELAGLIERLEFQRDNRSFNKRYEKKP